MINESTFEARVFSEIQQLFPLLTRNDITLQKTFTLKIGHHEIEIKNESKKARLDILLNYQDKPLAILELKAPGKELTNDDVDQGISYARLIDPMAPLTIISNGDEVKIFNSYEKKLFVKAECENITVQELFTSCAKCAAADLDNAIQVLLGQNPEFWNSILVGINDLAFLSNKGGITDLNTPICDLFQIKREVTDTLLESVITLPLVILTGKPFSGKTNVAYQLYGKRSTNLFPIYFDASNPNPGIIRHLANKLSHSLFTKATSDDVRNWLINSLCKQRNNRVVFIIDNIMSSNDEVWKEIYELIEINSNKNFSMLLIVNDEIYKNMKTVKGKMALSAIGKAKCLNVSPLTDNEFDQAVLILFEKFKIDLYNGSQFNAEYRSPRLLRILLAQNYKFTRLLSNTTTICLPSITTYDLLLSLWDETSQELREAYKFMAEAILNQSLEPSKDPYLSILSYSNGVLTLKAGKSFVGEGVIKELIDQGYLKTLHLHNGDTYLVPLLPEVLSVAAAYAIFDKMNSGIVTDDEELYKFFINSTQQFPNPDLTGMLVIVFASERNKYFISRVLPRLINDRPVVEPAKKSGRILLNTISGIKELDLKDFKNNSDDEGTMISNSFPWLLLSNLLQERFVDDKNGAKTWLECVAFIGSFEDVLFRISNQPIEFVKEFHVHELDSGIHVLCGKMGIIEPITQAMQEGFIKSPELMLKLVESAAKQGNQSLRMRLQVAANSLKNIEDDTISNTVKKVSEILSFDA